MRGANTVSLRVWPPQAARGGGLLGNTWWGLGEVEGSSRGSRGSQWKIRDPGELREPPSSVVKDSDEPATACPNVGSRTCPLCPSLPCSFCHLRTGCPVQAGREGGCFTQHHMSGKDKCKNIKSLWSWGQITRVTRLSP